MKKNIKSRAVTKEDIFDISLLSSNAKNKEVYIFEISVLSNFLEPVELEHIRENFLKNSIKVKQITNISQFPKFTGNTDFVNQVMQFRFVPKNIFDIKKEIIIFDDTVAIYDAKEILVIQDEIFSNQQKQLFESVWNEGESPKFDFPYIPNHSFYKSIDLLYEDFQVIVWPDADGIESYNGFAYNDLRDYIAKIIENDNDYYKDASYVICFIWSLDGEKMLDMWKFEENSVDDRSGPLSEARVYKEGILCNNIGLASGNTLLVLGYEEKIRRQSPDLNSYLNGPEPKLPLEMMNGLNFFEYNK